MYSITVELNRLNLILGNNEYHEKASSLPRTSSLQSPLTESDVEAYLKDDVIKYLWERLQSVRYELKRREEVLDNFDL